MRWTPRRSLTQLTNKHRMSSMIKNIIVICGLIALAAVGYYLFVAQRSASLNGTGLDSSSQANIELNSFLIRLQELETIDLSNSLFSDARFRSLQDNSKTITPAAVGRVNPFASASGSGL